MRRIKLVLSASLLAIVGMTGAVSATPLWRDVKATAMPLVGPRLITPVVARTFSMDYEALRIALAKAPSETNRSAAAALVELPMPDGSSATFRMVETAVMAPALAAKFPRIKTYAGTAVNDPLMQGRFDVGPRGFHGQIFTTQDTIYIDPYSRGDVSHYQAYFKRDLRPQGSRPADKVIVPSRQKPAAKKSSLGESLIAKKGVSIAGDLRTYRLALAANGEYSQFVDPDTMGPAGFPAPDKTIVLAELVNVANRVTGVYERELGIRLQLVADEDQLIYQYAQLDPYTNDQGIAMLEVNTTVINGKIGNANYDIGHVVSTGGGGVAGLGVVCNRAMKGAGVTGLSAPTGDGFYIDYVAHEMGHQFGGNHTFNSELGSCGGGNRNADTAFEPGSGITIMAYAGICDTDNLAPHSIDTFHAGSYDEIVAYTREAEGNDCAVITSTTNHPPVADAGVGGFTIPKLTPFELTGSGSDPDGDPITFQWEQMDLGAAGTTEAPDATAPLFRSFLPTTSPKRSFPQASDLAANKHTIGELLPAVARTLNFRLTVRDNRTTAMGTPEKPEAGGVSSADLKFFVAGTGPFLVKSPNGSETYKTGVPFDVSWEVAGTDVAPISCAAVDILLSTDGGMSYPFTLATAQPNNGQQTVTAPALSVTDTARIRVKCASNVFFDISDANFSIVPGPAPSTTTTTTPPAPTTPTTPPDTTPTAPPASTPVTPVTTPVTGTAATVAAKPVETGRFGGGSWPALGSLLLGFAALLRRRRL